MNTLMEQYLPVAIMFAVALVFALGFMGASWLLGPKNPTKTKLSVYECGHNPIGSARERFGVKFYLVAILFIVFDIEVVFMYPWALNFKKAMMSGAGWYYFAIMAEFFVILGIGLFYGWRSGVLNWAKREL